MLNYDEDQELEARLQYMLIDAYDMTDRCGGIFMSGQAIAAIIACWKFIK